MKGLRNIAIGLLLIALQCALTGCATSQPRTHSYTMKTAGNDSVPGKSTRIACFPVTCWGHASNWYRGKGVKAMVNLGKRGFGGYHEGLVVYHDPDKLNPKTLAKFRSYAKKIASVTNTADVTLSTLGVIAGGCIEVVVDVAKDHSVTLSFDNLPQSWQLLGADENGKLKRCTGTTVLHIQTVKPGKSVKAPELNEHGQVVLDLSIKRGFKTHRVDIPVTVGGFRGKHKDPHISAAELKERKERTTPARETK